MFAVCVVFNLVPGRLSDFLPLMQAQARNSLDLEPDCHRFDICSDGADTVLLYELYSDPSSFLTHLDSAHFKQFDSDVADMVVEKTVQTFGHVIPGT